jgi:hypothetical protein
MTIDSSLWNTVIKPRLQGAGLVSTPDTFKPKDTGAKRTVVIDITCYYRSLGKATTWEQAMSILAQPVKRALALFDADSLVVCTDCLIKNEARLFVDGQRNNTDRAQTCPVDPPDPLALASEFPWPGCDRDGITAYGCMDWRARFLYPFVEHFFLRVFDYPVNVITHGFNATNTVYSRERATGEVTTCDAPKESPIVEGDFKVMAWSLWMLENGIDVCTVLRDGDQIPSTLIQMDYLKATRQDLYETIKEDRQWTWIYNLPSGWLFAPCVGMYEHFTGMLPTPKWPGCILSVLISLRMNDYVPGTNIAFSKAESHLLRLLSASNGDHDWVGFDGRLWTLNRPFWENLIHTFCNKPGKYSNATAVANAEFSLCYFFAESQEILESPSMLTGNYGYCRDEEGCIVRNN